MIVNFDIPVEADLTTGESGDLEGDAENLEGPDGTATLVENEFEVEATGESVVGVDIDDELGLPAAAGDNYFELTLDLDVTDLDDIEGKIPVTTFRATESDGFVSFDTDDPDENRFDLGEDLDEQIELEGVIFDDDTWASSFVNIPPIDLEDEIVEAAEDAIEDELPDELADLLDPGIITDNLEYDSVAVVKDKPIEGEYRPSEDLVTGTLDLELRIEAIIDEICLEVDLGPIGEISECVGPYSVIDLVLDPDRAEMTTHESNGGETDGMQGSAEGLGTETPSVNFVAQEFAVEDYEADSDLEEIENFVVEDVLGLPSEAGRNWLDLEFAFENAEALIQPFIALEPQTSVGGEHLVVSSVEPAQSGRYIGIWSLSGGDPVTLLGVQSVDEPAETVEVAFESRLLESQTVMVAVHPETEDGDPDTDVVLASATAEIEIAPPPIAGGELPVDVDGDGLYEHTTGEGDPGVADVQLLFDNLGNDTVQDFSRFYNFSGTSEDRVTIFDVQALFVRVTSS